MASRGDADASSSSAAAPALSHAHAVSIDYADGSPAVRLGADGSGRVFYRGAGAERRGPVAAFVDVHAETGASAAFFFDEPNESLAPPRLPSDASGGGSGGVPPQQRWS